MGNCVSFQVSCDQMVNLIFGCLCDKGYIGNLKENLKALEREMEDLKAIQHDVLNKVEREERLHRKRLETVKVWLTRVENIDTHVNNLLSNSPIQFQKLCLCGLCSKNVCSSYKYGKDVFSSLEYVKKLQSRGNLEMVTELTSISELDEKVTWVATRSKVERPTRPAPRSEVEERPTGSALRSEVEERPTRPTIGQEEMLEKAWNCIKEDEIGIMGLHGMGGVGKTTLFEKIHNKFAELPRGRFDVVFWIVVSQGANIQKIQDDIAQKLNLCGDEWMKKNESDKATEMYRVLKGKRFVLMLDDIWEKLDLEAIGVPIPNIANGCKVAFTTRSKEICVRMGAHKAMQVKCLEESKAWELFKSKLVNKTLSREPAIVDLAREVAEKCHGLPLALTVIGETMAFKTTIQEWRNAIDVLRENAAEFSDMENKVLPILKYSYDSLKNDDIRSCFLYCALFPEDDNIFKSDLIDYWICEGFIGEYKFTRRAKNKGYDILGTLICANLLMEVDLVNSGKKDAIVMHDVVREMALWIASDFGKQKENFFVQARVGLHEIQVKDRGAVRRMSLMKNTIHEITCDDSKYSELTTLFLQKNRLENLSGEFIQSMQKLLVLDLSDNRRFSELPDQISELTSLKYLNLSSTSIKQLPVGFQELKKLTHLNLAFTRRLHSVSGISKLPSLNFLNVYHSKVDGDVNLLKELQLLEHLQVLFMTITSALAFEIISGDQRLANCFDQLKIDGYQQMPLGESELLVSMESSHVSEINTNMKCREREMGLSSLRNPTSPCFTNLSKVYINNSNGMKDLTWLLAAPNLVSLEVCYARELKEIINKEKATNLTDNIIPFQKLESLLLSRLSKLESIYWSPLPFPFLKRIGVTDCYKLSKLPLNATSVPRVKEFLLSISFSQPLFEWEDQATENRFLPSIVRDETPSYLSQNIF